VSHNQSIVSIRSDIDKVKSDIMHRFKHQQQREDLIKAMRGGQRSQITESSDSELSSQQSDFISNQHQQSAFKR
jgi:hypothetical protein